MLATFFLSVWLSAASFDPGAATPRDLLTIETSAGVKHAFKVEVVKDESERNRGLMFRQSLDDDGGMLFDYDPPEEISFWMKNTFIPLDMIFIGADGRIRRIAENTKPLSKRLISSGGRVRAVLEINAGTARKLGIAPGNMVSHPIFAAKPR